MNDWDATSYAAKDNLLRVVRLEAEALFKMAEAACGWTGPTACPKWEVRDVVGHLIDVTESYFTGFQAAATGADVAEPLGVKVMQDRLDEGAKAHRELAQPDAVATRLRGDFEKMMELCAALGPEEWGGRQVVHRYMGAAAGVLLPGVPAHGLQRARLGHPPGHRPGARAGRRYRRTRRCRSCSCCGRRPRRSRTAARRSPSASGCPAATPWTTW